MTLVVEMLRGNISDILQQILSKIVSQRFYLITLPQLLHHLSTLFDSFVVVMFRLVFVLPRLTTFQMVQQTGTLFPLGVRAHFTHLFLEQETVVFQDNIIDQVPYELSVHLTSCLPKLAEFVSIENEQFSKNTYGTSNCTYQHIYAAVLG